MHEKEYEKRQMILIYLGLGFSKKENEVGARRGYRGL